MERCQLLIIPNKYQIYLFKHDEPSHLFSASEDSYGRKTVNGVTNVVA